MDKLKEYSIINDVFIGVDDVIVRYASGVSESYSKKELMNTVLFKNPIHIGKEFITDPLKPDYENLKTFFLVRKRDYKRAGFFDKKICIHTLTRKLIDEGFVFHEYPVDMLENDFNSIDHTKFFKNNKLILSPGRSHRLKGRCVQESFYDFSDDEGASGHSISGAWKRPVFLSNIISSLAGRKNITKTNIIRKMVGLKSERKCGVTPVPPGFYLALFKRLGLSFNTIHDTNPTWISKAIAAAKVDCRYTYSDIKIKSKADKFNKFVNSIGMLPVTSYSPLEDAKADILMLDGNLDTDSDPAPYIDDIGKKWGKIVVYSTTPSVNCIEVEPYYFERRKLFFNIIS